jgi:hypothetical protein
MKLRTDLTVASVSGIAFLVTILLLAIAFPSPTPFQYEVFKVVFALSCAAFASAIPGLLDFRVGHIIKASGATAVFIVLYFNTPAQLITGSEGDEKRQGQNAIFEAVQEQR